MVMIKYCHAKHFVEKYVFIKHLFANVELYLFS